MPLERLPKNFDRDLHGDLTLTLSDLRRLLAMTGRASTPGRPMVIEIDNEFRAYTFDDVVSIYHEAGRDRINEIDINVDGTLLRVWLRPTHAWIATIGADPDAVQIAEEVYAFLKPKVGSGHSKEHLLDLEEAATLPTSPSQPTVQPSLPPLAGVEFTDTSAAPMIAPLQEEPTGLRKIWKTLGPVGPVVVGVATVGAFVLGLITYLQQGG